MRLSFANFGLYLAIVFSHIFFKCLLVFYSHHCGLIVRRLTVLFFRPRSCGATYGLRFEAYARRFPWRGSIDQWRIQTSTVTNTRREVRLLQNSHDMLF